MGTLHFLVERRPVEYVVRVSHHFNGTVEVVVEGVGDSPDDRRKIAAALLEAAALVEDDAAPAPAEQDGRMPTVQNVELQLLREFETAREANNESRMAELIAALRVVRELFGDHLLMGGR